MALGYVSGSFQGLGEGLGSRVLDGSWLVPVSESCCGNVPEGSRNLAGDWQVPRFGEVAKNGRRKFPRRFGGARVPGGNGKESFGERKVPDKVAGRFWKVLGRGADPRIAQ